MYKNILLTAVPLTSVLTATAAEIGDTILHKTDVKAVVLTDNDSIVALTIKGTKDEPDYTFNYEPQMKAGAVSKLTEHSIFGFDLFYSKKNKQNRKLRSDALMTGGWSLCVVDVFSFGFVTTTGAPEGLDVDMGSSYEISWEIFNVYKASRCGHHAVSAGFGLNWRNFRLDGRQRFVKTPDGIALADYPDGADIDFSRIKVFSLMVPISYNYKPSRHWLLRFSVIPSFNTYASIKTRYRNAEGQKVKDMAKHIHQSPVTVDFRVDARWHRVGLYAKYSPCRGIRADFGPKFTRVSTGVSFFF